MALAKDAAREVPAQGDGGAGSGRTVLATVLGALPPPALILIGTLSVQVGAGLAKQLFATVPPAAVTLLRLWSSALVLLAASVPALLRTRRASARPAATGTAWRSLGVAALFGLTLAAMNFSIYQSIARIPLGIAVTIEFLGPLGLAVAASRRLADLIWVVLAGGGVALLARVEPVRAAHGGHVAVAGVIFALISAACWAAYILLSAATGRRFPGSAGLVLAMTVAAVAITPVGAAAAGRALLRPGVIAVGAAIGLLSSVIPYTLELASLRRISPRVFSILMSLEPAVAALVGLVLLGQVLLAREWLAIGCVMVACIGATRR